MSNAFYYWFCVISSASSTAHCHTYGRCSKRQKSGNRNFLARGRDTYEILFITARKEKKPVTIWRASSLFICRPCSSRIPCFIVARCLAAFTSVSTFSLQLKPYFSQYNAIHNVVNGVDSEDRACMGINSTPVYSYTTSLGHFSSSQNGTFLLKTNN